MIPPILQQAEALIAKGVGWSVVVRVLFTLLPQALSITHPDGGAPGHPHRLRPAIGRPRVRRHAGVRHQPLPRCCARWRSSPSSARAATAYETHRRAAEREPDDSGKSRCKSSPSGSRTTSSRGVFFEEFPNRVLYVRDLPPGGGWRDVFLADSTQAGSDDGLFRAGRPHPRRSRARMVQLQLTDGTGTRRIAEQARGLRRRPNSSSISAEPGPGNRVPAAASSAGAPEMTIAELRADASADARNDTAARLQPAVHDPVQVRDAGRLPRAGADRRWRSASATARTASWPASSSASA